MKYERTTPRSAAGTGVRFQTIEDGLDMMSFIFASLESRFPPMTKAIFEFDALSSHILRHQSTQTETFSGIAARDVIQQSIYIYRDLEETPELVALAIGDEFIARIRTKIAAPC